MTDTTKEPTTNADDLLQRVDDLEAELTLHETAAAVIRQTLATLAKRLTLTPGAKRMRKARRKERERPLPLDEAAEAQPPTAAAGAVTQ